MRMGLWRMSLYRAWPPHGQLTLARTGPGSRRSWLNPAAPAACSAARNANSTASVSNPPDLRCSAKMRGKSVSISRVIS